MLAEFFLVEKIQKNSENLRRIQTFVKKEKKLRKIMPNSELLRRIFSLKKEKDVLRRIKKY
jgi:hypothetical protein